MFGIKNLRAYIESVDERVSTFVAVNNLNKDRITIRLDYLEGKIDELNRTMDNTSRRYSDLIELQRKALRRGLVHPLVEDYGTKILCPLCLSDHTPDDITLYRESSVRSCKCGLKIRIPASRL